MESSQLRSYFEAKDLDKPPACERQSDRAIRFAGKRQEQFHSRAGQHKFAWLGGMPRGQVIETAPFRNDSREGSVWRNPPATMPGETPAPKSLLQMGIESFRGALGRRGRKPMRGPLAPVAPVGTGFGRYIPQYADVVDSTFALMWHFVPVPGGLRVAVPLYAAGVPVPWSQAAMRAKRVARSPTAEGYVLIGDTFVPASLGPGRRHILASTGATSWN